MIAINLFKIVDLADGRELSHGEEGEVLLRGDVTMLGYLDNPDATAEGLDDDGWWKSGTHMAMGNVTVITYKIQTWLLDFIMEIYHFMIFWPDHFGQK